MYTGKWGHRKPLDHSSWTCANPIKLWMILRGIFYRGNKKILWVRTKKKSWQPGSRLGPRAWTSLPTYMRVRSLKLTHLIEESKGFKTHHSSLHQSHLCDFCSHNTPQAPGEWGPWPRTTGLDLVSLPLSRHFFIKLRRGSSFNILSIFYFQKGQPNNN